jgi:hypothetical protein
VARLIAYDAATCAFLQQKDMPSGFDSARGWVTVPLAGWSATAPLDNVQFLRVESVGDGPLLYTYDAAGAYVSSIPITTLGQSDYLQGMVFDPVADRLHLLTENYFSGGSYRLLLSSFPRPGAAATEITPTLSKVLSLPCTRDPQLAGIDAAGNLYFAQLQLDGLSYRVCGYGAAGELFPQPYFWTPQVAPEHAGFLVGGGAHFVLDTNSGQGPSVIERAVYQAP